LASRWPHRLKVEGQRGMIVTPTCSSLLSAITHNWDGENKYIAFESRLMGRPVEYFPIINHRVFEDCNDYFWWTVKRGEEFELILGSFKIHFFLNRLVYVMSNGRMFCESWILKDMEGRGPDMRKGSTCRNWENHETPQDVRIAAHRPRFRNRYRPCRYKTFSLFLVKCVYSI
jgi:hypothetical protein